MYTPHLALQNLWYPLQIPPWKILGLMLLYPFSIFNHISTYCSLISLWPWVFSLSVLCKHCLCRQVCTWPGLLSVFIRVGIEACWRLERYKHVLNGCLLLSVGDVILCAAKFSSLHMQMASRATSHTGNI